MWQYTDKNKTAVFRVDEANRYYFLMLEDEEIQQWLNAGNVPLEPPVKDEPLPMVPLTERIERLEKLLEELLAKVKI